MMDSLLFYPRSIWACFQPDHMPSLVVTCLTNNSYGHKGCNSDWVVHPLGDMLIHVMLLDLFLNHLLFQFQKFTNLKFFFVTPTSGKFLASEGHDCVPNSDHTLYIHLSLYPLQDIYTLHNLFLFHLDDILLDHPICLFLYGLHWHKQILLCHQSYFCLCTFFWH
jgi:hypothetical protein